jgi:putative acetyltransferase
MESIRIREIQKQDNAQMAAIVRDVLTDFGAPKVGTAYADPYLDTLFEVYDIPRAIYFVVENNGKILGGAGIMQLENAEASICELQKMYFLPELRGLGFGTKLMNLCLEKAVEYGFENCYIETMTYMDAAQKLYRKSGFEYLEQQLGDTGHNSCEVWMLKKLK